MASTVQSTSAIGFQADELLSKPSVRVNNTKRVEELLREFIEGGTEKLQYLCILQVIADFDMTLSRFHINGQRCMSTHCTLENSELIPKHCQEMSRVYFNKYYPVEMDPTIPFEQKYTLMTEWWDKTHSVLLDCGLKKSDIAEIIKDCKTVLRDGCSAFLETLQRHNVPLLIFSAGLGDLILEVIRQQATLHNNIFVISNFMEFDEDGVIKGFKGETIHIFNKNANACKKDGYFDGLQGRCNVILLGDSPGDITMCDGVPEAQNIFKIGFLNDKIEERLAEYMDMYDIVLVDDQSYNVINDIFRRIAK